MSWRMKAKCDNCPFSKDGKGAHLRKSLRPGRMVEIRRGLLMGDVFNCHKTTEETGDGSELMCAGALEFQEQHGVSSNLQRVMERIEYCIPKADAAAAHRRRAGEE